MMNDMDSKEFRKKKVWDAKTKLILDAALEVLAQKGYHETRLEDIAEKAGFSKSALYRYYKDKEEIFFTIATKEINKVIGKLVSEPYRLTKENNIRENIRRLLTVSLTAWGEHFSFLLAMNSFQVIALINALQKQAKLMKVKKDFLCIQSKMIEMVVEMFDNAKKIGDITTELDSKVIYEFYQGIIFSRVKKWHQQKKMEDIEKAVNEIMSFLCKGLGVVPV